MAATFPYPKRSIQQLMNVTNLDALGAAVFGRQLEDIDTQSYQYVFENLIAEQLFPSRTLAPGKTSYTWRTYSRAGMARIIASGYATDIPRVDILGEEQMAKARRMAAMWAMDIDELAASQSGDIVDLNAEKAITARAAVLQKLESIAAFGDSSYGLLGIANQPNTLTVTLPAGAAGGSTTRWDSGKTYLEVLNDLQAMVSASVTASKGTMVPDTLLINNRQRFVLQNMNIGFGSNTTVLDYFLGHNGYIKSVVVWEQLTGAGSGGTDRAVMYKRDPQYVQLITDAERTEGPQQEGLAFQSFVTRRTAGVICRYPLSVVVADGG